MKWSHVGSDFLPGGSEGIVRDANGDGNAMTMVEEEKIREIEKAEV